MFIILMKKCIINIWLVIVNLTFTKQKQLLVF